MGLILLGVEVFAPLFGIFLLLLANSANDEASSYGFGFTGIGVLIVSYFGMFVAAPIGVIIGMKCVGVESSKVRRRGAIILLLQVTAMGAMAYIVSTMT